MPTRRNRNGLATRVLSPVGHSLGLITNTGSRVLRTGNSVLGALGRGARGVVKNTGHHLNGAVHNLLTGRRKRGGSRKKHTRRNRKNRR